MDPAPDRRRCRPIATRAVLVFSALSLVILPACGGLRRHLFGASNTRSGTLTVTPPRGPAGQPYSLSAGGLRPGESMTFEIDPPNHRRFIGPPHVAGPDGRVVSTYTPLAGAPAGTYRVKAVGARGTRAEAGLVIVASTTSTQPG